MSRMRTKLSDDEVSNVLGGVMNYAGTEIDPATLRPVTATADDVPVNMATAEHDTAAAMKSSLAEGAAAMAESMGLI